MEWVGGYFLDIHFVDCACGEVWGEADDTGQAVFPFWGELEAHTGFIVVVDQFGD
jgi:hypothetical protein